MGVLSVSYRGITLLLLVLCFSFNLNNVQLCMYWLFSSSTKSISIYLTGAYIRDSSLFHTRFLSIVYCILEKKRHLFFFLSCCHFNMLVKLFAGNETQHFLLSWSALWWFLINSVLCLFLYFSRANSINSHVTLAALLKQKYWVFLKFIFKFLFTNCFQLFKENNPSHFWRAIN